jgi:hypothetical protein
MQKKQTVGGTTTMSNKFLFPVIPMMEGENMTITGPEDCGDGNYVTIFSDTTKAEYEAYLASLEEVTE